MRHAYILISLFALLTLGSCSRHAAATSDILSRYSLTDTVVIHEDGIVYVPYAVPGDTSRVFIPVDCDSLGRVRAAGLSTAGRRSSVSTLLIHDSTGHQSIEVVAGCAELLDSVRVMHTTIEHTIHERDSIATARSQTVMVQYVPGFYKWCTGLFWALIIIIIVITGITLYLKFKP